MKSTLYTGKGDKGKTSLTGGTQVEKHDSQIEAYGTIDELNSHIGMLRSYSISDDIKKMLKEVQHRLFDIGAYLATEPQYMEKYDCCACDEDDVKALEDMIDRIDATLPKQKSFILPGGDVSVSACHIARTVCRRAERKVSFLTAKMEIEDSVCRYINRLSDFLYVVARKLAQDLCLAEIKWVSKKS